MPGSWRAWPPDVLEAQGVYRAPTDNGYLFMAIMGIRSAA